jgi:hypothetical protein
MHRMRRISAQCHLTSPPDLLNAHFPPDRLAHPSNLRGLDRGRSDSLRGEDDLGRRDHARRDFGTGDMSRCCLSGADMGSRWLASTAAEAKVHAGASAWAFDFNGLLERLQRTGNEACKGTERNVEARQLD